MSLGPLGRVSRITEDEPSPSASQTGFWLVGVPATWVQVLSWVLAGFQFQHMGSSPSLVNGFHPNPYSQQAEARSHGANEVPVIPAASSL